MKMIKKTLAVTVASSLVITAPGLGSYAAAQRIYGTPVNGGNGSPVSPTINSNSRTGGVVVGSQFGANSNLQRGANGQFRRAGTDAFATEQTDGVGSVINEEAPLRPDGDTSPTGRGLESSPMGEVDAQRPEWGF